MFYSLEKHLVIRWGLTMGVVATLVTSSFPSIAVACEGLAANFSITANPMKPPKNTEVTFTIKNISGHEAVVTGGTGGPPFGITFTPIPHEQWTETTPKVITCEKRYTKEQECMFKFMYSGVTGKQNLKALVEDENGNFASVIAEGQ
jgi:hypothetical protein